MYLRGEHGGQMDKSKYYVVKKKAVPEVLMKVLEAKRLIDSERCLTVQEATEKVGISRSSFYKYKDDIFPFHESEQGRTLTLMAQLDDTPGLLSVLLAKMAEFDVNILTIHQSIPLNGIATVTVSVEILSGIADSETFVSELEELEGVHYLKILGRE